MNYYFCGQKQIIIVFTAFVLIFSNGASAQKAWTLEECIKHAMENNLQLKQTRLNTDLEQQNLAQNTGQLLPTVNGNVSHLYNFGRTIDRFTNQFATDRVLSQNFYLSGNFTVFNGLQTYNSIKQGQYNYLASKYETEKFGNDIALNIAASYLQILFSKELLRIAEDQAVITSQQVERTKRLVEAGTLAKGSLLEIEAQYATEEVAVANAQNQFNLAYINLALLLNIDDINSFKIVDPDVAVPAENILNANTDQIYSFASSNQPEIKSAELRIKGSEKGLAAARGGYSPRLVLTGSYGTGYSGASQRFLRAVSTGVDTIGFTADNQYVFAPSFSAEYEKIPFSDQINDNQNKTFGFNLTIPILNGLQTKTSISRAKIQKQKAELDLEINKDQLRKTILQAYADAQAALKKYSASAKAVTAMEESFKYTEQKFNVGLLNSFDYSNSKTKLAKSQSDLLQAKYDYVFKIKVLDFYQGKPLTF